MQSIPTLFVREPNSARATPEVNPASAWAAMGEGRASTKFDGSACAIFNGNLYKRYMLTMAKSNVLPYGFLTAGEIKPSGAIPGWVPCEADNLADQYHGEAFIKLINYYRQTGLEPTNGQTFELVGPKINKNPHGFDSHLLLPHGAVVHLYVPRDYEGLGEFLRTFDGEGLVFTRRNADGTRSYSKVKRKDYGYSWPIPQEERALMMAEHGLVA